MADQANNPAAKTRAARLSKSQMPSAPIGAATAAASTPIRASWAFEVIRSSGPSRTTGKRLLRDIPWNREKTSRANASGNRNTVSSCRIMTRLRIARMTELITKPPR